MDLSMKTSTTTTSSTTPVFIRMGPLNGISASELVFSKQTLVDIHAEKSVLDALQFMHANEIHALPVFGDSSHGLAAAGGQSTVHATDLHPRHHPSTKMYLGIISMADVLAWVLMNSRLNEHSLFTALSTLHVVQLVGLCKESKSLWIAPQEATLLSIMEPLTKGLHRWLIPRNPHSSHLSLCTLSDVLRYLLHQGFPMPRPWTAQKLMSIPQGFTQDSQVRDLLHWMLERDLPVIPIVTSNETTLLGVLRLRSFRSLSMLTLALKGESVERYLEPPLTVDLTTSMEEMVQVLVTHRAHEVWVVKKKEMVLKGLVTLTDVLKVWFEMFLPDLPKKKFTDY
ncbi:hypothetical protein HMI54_014577 [Coelomomyces lativittatus]|nr:hypothetical protein HMI56_002082 [Coelomomyces lativittatus]KAJ1508437.1 hypothetical protein HMI55_000373 [Coelomomyces lativittatus]KAJ1513972.1 hypothetical protein HMI54_014577 [Coelomomyces lativittatus]